MTDYTTLSRVWGGTLSDALFSQVLATCSPILTREQMGKRQKELVKRCVLTLLQLTAPFKYEGALPASFFNGSTDQSVGRRGVKDSSRDWKL